ncbi:MAG: hypothetical protein ABH874_07210 [Methanobacteriota archaeon]
MPMTERRLAEFRKKVEERREREWIRDSLLLRNKTPEETLRIMFDLVDFAEKLSRMRKCEP